MVSLDFIGPSSPNSYLRAIKNKRGAGREVRLLAFDLSPYVYQERFLSFV